jgi:hypothetical protein
MEKVTAHHKSQIHAALDLYQRRGEWDGASVQQARRVLARAGYVWKPWIKEEVLRHMRKTPKAKTSITAKALRDLFRWMTTGDRNVNPYTQPAVTGAILTLNRGGSRYDKPGRRPKSKIGAALYDLVKLATLGDRHGNPYTKPEVRAASRALGGDGYDIPSR